MMNRYFILVLLSLILASCSNSPQPKTQQRPLAPDETAVSTASQTSEAESNVNSNLDENITPSLNNRASIKPYSPQLVNNFMGACTQKGGSQITCGCTINTFEQNFSEPEYIKMEQQFVATGKLPEFIIQEIRNNCSNSEVQTPIARSQQEYLDLQNQLDAIAVRREFRQAGIARVNMAAESQQRTTQESVISAGRLPSEMMKNIYGNAGRGITSGNAEHPCDYPNQRDSQGNYCGDRSAVVRPGGRF